MAREMPYRVILPLDHKTESKARYSVVYLLHGLTGHYTNWTDKTALAEFAAKHNFVIVTPEGNNGWVHGQRLDARRPLRELYRPGACA